MVRSQLRQRAASSAGQKSEAWALSQTSHWIFMFVCGRVRREVRREEKRREGVELMVGCMGQKNYGRLGFRLSPI